MKSIKIKITVFILLSYLILFELLYPANGFFPSFSVILLSLKELFDNYNFLSNFISTSAAVYTIITANYFFTRILFILFCKVNSDNLLVAQSITFLFHYIPFILISLLILIWLPDFIFDKYLIAILIFLPLGMHKVFGNENSDKKEYFNFYKSLGIKNSLITNKIMFKLFEPKYFLTQIENHSFIWSVVILTEFIQQKEGIGGILFAVFNYQDVSLLFSITVFISFLVFLIQKTLSSVYFRVYFWD